MTGDVARATCFVSATVVPNEDLLENCGFSEADTGFQLELSYADKIKR
jgi:hypothetical protein